MRIAISGAGVAGPALAFWLCRTGHEPVLIEKAPQFRGGGYMVDFWGTGYSIAERMGILPNVLAEGYKVREVRLVDRSGRKAGGFSTDVLRQITQDRFTSLPRGELARTIYRTIENRVETVFGDSIAAIQQDASRVRVEFEHGAPRDFDLVVGADGLHSQVRKLVFGPQEKFEKQLGYRVAAFEVDGYANRDELAYVSYTTPGRQIARFALRGGRTLFLFVFVEEQMSGPEPESTAQRKAALSSTFGDAGWECPQILDAMQQVDDIYFDRVSQIHMGSWSQGRVVLIGDAAACPSLLAGEGSGLAITEAYVLAGELQRLGGDFAAAFRAYEQQLRPTIEKKQASAKDFGSAFAPRTRAGVWFRNHVASLLYIRPLATYFIGRSLRDDFALPNYAM